MVEVLKPVLTLLHVLGWAAWLGLAIAEASVGVQVRKATDVGGRAVLARLWGRVGRIQIIAMAVALVFGYALFAFDLATSPFGAQGFMQQRAFLFVHVMLGLGTVAGALALLAGRARGKAVAAVDAGNASAFSAPYKKAAMFSGMASLLLVATLAVVFLRTL